MNFNSLIKSIQQTHQVLQEDAIRAINRNLTIRNWLIGFYIVEFEQNGEDRAAYGERVLQKLSERLGNGGYSHRNLKLYRQFFAAYPQLMSIAKELLKTIPAIGQPLIAQLPEVNKQSLHGLDGLKLISKLSYTHIVELLPIDNPVKRAFYEIECASGSWSVRELRRQIHTLYFERSGLSADPAKLTAYVQSQAVSLTPRDVIQSPFTFEFLGLRAKDALAEEDLETALLDNLQSFMLELGTGFCLEARQKRILIGDEYYFVDLVFYHRVLRCHILVELKVDSFKHEHSGQLNSYVGYYKHEVMLPTDNPPVSILLVTDQNETLVEYAIAGLDNQLFVKDYLVQLPTKNQLIELIRVSQ